MSIYDAFFASSSPFLEKILYLMSDAEDAVEISVNVNKKTKQMIEIRGKSRFQGQVYPVEIFLKRADVSTVTIDKDIVTLNDILGISTEYFVAEILEATEDTYILGLMKKKASS